MTNAWTRASAVAITIAAWSMAVSASRAADAASANRPNLLWISIEDASPDFGCYGDRYAISPVVDRLAAQGVRFTRVFSHSGVCAPTRSGIITGMYPAAIATHHMRCQGVPPAEVKCFPEYLRALGYYCTNNVKTDYQFQPPASAWDENSAQAHWRKRASDQPFFAVFNFVTTHESQIRAPSKQTQNLAANLKPEQRHDPAKAVLPPYYPDTPAVRRDWANYYDNLTAVEVQIQQVLDQLEQDGLADDTIVWFWGDHGRGLPRSKRWLYDSGSHVPLIIRVPEKWRARVMPDAPDSLKPGSVRDDLIAYVDFAPTMLALAGATIPSHLQGRPFLGAADIKPRDYIFGARDRMDERYDLIRMARDKKYKYIRNFMPHLTYAQNVSYMNEMPTMKEMRRLHAAGQLSGPPALFFRDVKPIEELYDTEADPHEVRNLADDPAHRETLTRMRSRLLGWMKEVGDLGLIPEAELAELERPGGEWATAEPPAIVSVNGMRITLGSPTPGASIVFRRGPNQPWQLHRGPVELDPQQNLIAKACRIGFRDSPNRTFNAANARKGPRPAAPASTAASDWRDRIVKEGWLDKLQTVKSLELAPDDEARSRYEELLADPIASVRYWSALGLRRVGRTPETIDRAKARLRDRLAVEQAPIVRVAIAETLCRWGDAKIGLPVLVETLKHRQQEVRLAAALALDEIGEAARPAQADVKRSLGDPFEYVTRVGEQTLLDLIDAPGR